MQLKCIQCGHVLNAYLTGQYPNCHKLWYRPYPCANDTINDDALFTAFLAMTTSDSPSYDYDSSSDSSSSCDSSSD